VSSSRVTNICVLCNGHDTIVIENYNGYYKVLKCLNCVLVYVNPIPQKELLEKNYSQEYYTPWLENQREKRIIMWRLRLKTLNGFSNKKGKLLDVGCGEGLLLELAKKDGWDVTGTEISPFAVTMWHVLEHTTNPVVVLKETRRILKAAYKNFKPCC